MKKQIMMVALTSAIALVGGNAFAGSGLKLCGDSSNKTSISVKCGPTGGTQHDTGFPVKAGQCAGPGGEFNWGLLKLVALSNQPTGSCTFTSPSGDVVGTADLAVQGNTGAVYNVDPHGNTISYNGYTPGASNFKSTIEVDIKLK